MPLLPSCNLTQLWKITMFNGKKTLVLDIFHSYVNLPEGKPPNGGDDRPCPQDFHAHDHHDHTLLWILLGVAIALAAATFVFCTK